MIEYSFKKCIKLDLIDCNCNDCKFMDRDMDKWQKWHDWHKELHFKEFYNSKGKAILESWELIDKAEKLNNENELKNAQGMLRVALKMKTVFEKKYLLSYGNCTKFNKPISFIPMTCQIDTQNCFEHRKI